MSAFTNAGAVISIGTADAPTDLDDRATWESDTLIEIGELEDVPSFSDQDAQVDRTTLKALRTQVAPGVAEALVMNMQVTLNDLDDGQIELDRIRKETPRKQYNLQIKLPNDPDNGADSKPTLLCFRGYVMGFQYAGGGPNEFNRRTLVFGANIFRKFAAVEHTGT